MRINGAWTGLLVDWLDRNHLDAPDVRGRLVRYAPEDGVSVALWRGMLADALALVPGRVAPELEVGAGVQPRHVGVLGYLVLACDTLGDAMLAYQRYEHLFYGEQLAELDSDGDTAEIRWEQGVEPLGLSADGVAIAALVTFLRGQIDSLPPPLRVSFHDQPDPDRAQAYREFFQCPVDFGDAYVRVRFPMHSLRMPMPRRDPTLRRLLNRQADAQSETVTDDRLLEEQMHRNLLPLLAEGNATLARMARALHMSPRTLQRRLARHGTGWQQWLDQVREQLARRYLADPALSLNEIALLLGFSEQSAFNRTFRRWTGVAPGRMRACIRNPACDRN